MDIGLPWVDGIETTVQIRSGRAKALNKNIPIVGLTGFSLKKDKVDSLQAGMNYVLVKPIFFAELENILITIAQRSF